MKIKINNFRSFKTTNFVEIKPITILVGKNSSGKSSFLRIFPLLKQSLMEQTKTPLLFYGRYVDFGSYKTIKPNFQKKDNPFSISFKFDFAKVIEETLLRKNRISRIKNNKPIVEDFVNKILTLHIYFKKDNKNLIYASKYSIRILNHNIDIMLDSKKPIVSKLKINNDEIKLPKKNKIFILDKGELIPIFFINILNPELYFYLKIKKLVDNFFKKTKNITEHEQNFILTSLIISKIEFLDLLELLKAKDLKSFIIKKIEEKEKRNKKDIEILNNFYEENKKEIKNLYNIFLIFGFIFPSLANYIKKIFLNSQYIAPLRATAERYYRIQHLAVNEIDPYGKNLPFFLDSLTEKMRESFEKWTQENF